MAAATPSVVATLTKARETKGTFRYEEDGDDPVLRTLYLPKGQASKLGNPDKITVTITKA